MTRTAVQRDQARDMVLSVNGRATLRVTLGDVVRWEGHRSMVHGVMHEGPALYVLIDWRDGRAWVPSWECDVIDGPEPLRPPGTPAGAPFDHAFEADADGTGRCRQCRQFAGAHLFGGNHG